MFPIFKPRYNHINLGLTHKLKRNIHRIHKTSTVYALNNYVKNYPRTGSPPKKGRWTPPPTFLMGYGTFTIASSSRIKILLLYLSGGANMHPHQICDSVRAHTSLTSNVISIGSTVYDDLQECLLNFPRYNMSNCGRRAFCFAGLYASCNSLPEHIRQSTSIAVFKRSLRTFLLQQMSHLAH